MSLKNVRKELVENQIKQLSQVSSNKALEDVAKKHYKMGNDYIIEKNYSLSFHSYYLSFNEYASIIVSKKAKELVDSKEAIEFLIKKGELKKDVLSELRDLYVRVGNREHLERKHCVMIRDMVVNLRKQVN